MSLTLKQGREISKLSNIPTDECTFVPEFGVAKDCVMHDHLLGLFVTFKDDTNDSQSEYMAQQDLYGYLRWSNSHGETGIVVTRKEVDHLFREALQKKIDTVGAWYKKTFYWNIRNLYYFGVTLYRRIKR